MHYPINLVIGPVVIPSHFIFNILAIVFGIRYYLVLRKRAPDHLDKQTRLAILFCGFMGGLLGARLLDMADAAEWPTIMHLGIVTYFFIGGKTIVGGVLGGMIGVEIAKYWKHVKRSTGDLFTFPLIYGIMIGRVGCFLTGVQDETVGLPSNLPWAMDQGDGIPRHPTALYEIIFLGLLWIALALLRKRVRLAEGELFRLFMLSYLTFRLLVDFLKPGVPIILGFTAIQIACTIGGLWYAIDILRIERNRRYANATDSTVTYSSTIDSSIAAASSQAV